MQTTQLKCTQTVSVAKWRCRQLHKRFFFYLFFYLFFFSFLYFIYQRWVNFLFVVINNNDCTLVTETFTMSWKKKPEKHKKIIQTHIVLLLLKVLLYYCLQYMCLTTLRSFQSICMQVNIQRESNEIVPMPINLLVVVGCSSQTTTKDLLNYRNISTIATNSQQKQRIWVSYGWNPS